MLFYTKKDDCGERIWTDTALTTLGGKDYVQICNLLVGSLLELGFEQVNPLIANAPYARYKLKNLEAHILRESVMIYKDGLVGGRQVFYRHYPTMRFFWDVVRKVWAEEVK